MYIGKIKNIADCIELGKENIALIVEFLKKNDLKTLAVGTYPLNKNNRVSVQEYTTKEPNGNFEAHRKYADVQVIVSGEERFGITENGATPGEYDAENDVEFFSGNGREIILSADGDSDCAVFMPGEPHAPGLCVSQPSPVKKAVFKILISK